MKKNSTIVVLLFTLNLLFSQSGQIFYEAISKKFPETNENKADIYISELENSKLKLELRFNKELSYFTKTNLNKEEGFNFGEQTLEILIGYQEVFYDSKKKYLYQDYGEVLVKEETNRNWNISTESKKIDNYVCYKATCTENFIARDGISKVRVITAWFCPQLPYSFGPLEYNDLPGLILELEKNGNKVIAKSIVFSDNEIKIQLPNKKTITKEAYNKKIRENSNF